jgi:hypothetical protein
MKNSFQKFGCSVEERVSWRLVWGVNFEDGKDSACLHAFRTLHVLFLQSLKANKD